MCQHKGSFAKSNSLPIQGFNSKYVWHVTGNDNDGWAFQNVYSGKYITLAGSSNNSSVTLTQNSSNLRWVKNGDVWGIGNDNGQFIDNGYGGGSAITWSDGVVSSRRFRFYAVDIEDYEVIPEVPTINLEKKTVSVGEKTQSITPQTQWYILSQIRNGETPVYANNSVMRAAAQKYHCFTFPREYSGFYKK